MTISKRTKRAKPDPELVKLADSLLANEGAREVAERALAAVDALKVPHSHSTAGGHVTISIGLATLVPEASSNATHLLDAADTALYAAKQHL